MCSESALEVFLDADGGSLNGFLHGDSVKDEVADEDTKREDEEGGVGRSLARSGRDEVVKVHGSSHEAVEERHEHTSYDGQHDALAGAALIVLLGHTARCQAIEDNGHDHQSHAAEQQHRVALRLEHVVVHHAYGQCQADAHGEGHGHAGQRDGCTQQDIGSIEDDAAQHSTPESSGSHLLKVGHEAASALADAAQGKAHDNGEEEHADDIVPIEQFITPALGGKFLRVAPRAPANHGNDAQHHGQYIIVYDKHSCIEYGFIFPY